MQPKRYKIVTILLHKKQFRVLLGVIVLPNKIKKKTALRCIIKIPVLKALGIALEKVEAEEGRNTEQHVCVDAVAVEDAVTSHTARAQLLAEPGDSAPLSLQFLMDFLSYVNVVGHAAKIRKFVLF